MSRTTMTAAAMALGLATAAWADDAPGSGVAAKSVAASSPEAEAVAASPLDTEFDHCWICDDDDPSAEPHLDPVCFLEALASRYRGLEGYRDVAQLVQVTSYDGQPAQRIETEIGCNVDDGRISIRTPLRQVGQWIGSHLRFRASEPMRRIQLQHDLWTAPHLSLFAPLEGQGTADEPGPRPTLEATEAHRVTVRNRTLIHLAVRAAATTGTDAKASMEFVVNPESMLVEEVRVKRKLADGADHETTLHITPLSASPPADRSLSDEPAAAESTPSGAARGEPTGPMRNGRDHSVQEEAKRDRPAADKPAARGEPAPAAKHGASPPASDAARQHFGG
jgi:hypothetical protein